jgi:hypothetical protein
MCPSHRTTLPKSRSVSGCTPSSFTGQSMLTSISAPTGSGSSATNKTPPLLRFFSRPAPSCAGPLCLRLL